MVSGTNVVDELNTNNDEISQPTMKIQHNNIWFNPLIKDYPSELNMLVQVINDSILTHMLTTSLAVTIKMVIICYFYFFCKTKQLDLLRFT